MRRRSFSTCPPRRCSRWRNGKGHTPSTRLARCTHTVTGSARSRSWSRSTSSRTRPSTCSPGSCTAPTSPTTETRPRSRAACSRSPRASTCSTSVTTVGSSCRCRSTTRSLPGAEPRFDHADLYRSGRRMYVAHTGADRIEVLDCAARSHLHALPDLPGVAGVLVDEEHDLLFSSDRGVERVSVFRCSDEQLLGQVAVGPHPNGLAYDRARRRLYSFNLGEPLGENCTASIVDLDSMSVVVELPLPGRPRWAVYDEERDVVYANIQEPAEIAVINCERAVIERALYVPSEGPHGLWLDSGRLFCAVDGCALLVLDRDSGDVLA